MTSRRTALLASVVLRNDNRRTSRFISVRDLRAVDQVARAKVQFGTERGASIGCSSPICSPPPGERRHRRLGTAHGQVEDLGAGLGVAELRKTAYRIDGCGDDAEEPEEIAMDAPRGRSAARQNDVGEPCSCGAGLAILACLQVCVGDVGLGQWETSRSKARMRWPQRSTFFKNAQNNGGR